MIVLSMLRSSNSKKIKSSRKVGEGHNESCHCCKYLWSCEMFLYFHIFPIICRRVTIHLEKIPPSLIQSTIRTGSIVSITRWFSTQSPKSDVFIVFSFALFSDLSRFALFVPMKEKTSESEDGSFWGRVVGGFP